MGTATPPEDHDERLALAEELAKRSLEGIEYATTLASTLLSSGRPFSPGGAGEEAERHWQRAKEAAVRSRDAEVALFRFRSTRCSLTLDGELDELGRWGATQSPGAGARQGAGGRQAGRSGSPAGAALSRASGGGTPGHSGIRRSVYGRRGFRRTALSLPRPCRPDGRGQRHTAAHAGRPDMSRHDDPHRPQCCVTCSRPPSAQRRGRRPVRSRPDGATGRACSTPRPTCATTSAASAAARRRCSARRRRRAATTSRRSRSARRCASGRRWR